MLLSFHIFIITGTKYFNSLYGSVCTGNKVVHGRNSIDLDPGKPPLSLPSLAS